MKLTFTRQEFHVHSRFHRQTAVEAQRHVGKYVRFLDTVSQKKKQEVNQYG